MTYATQALMARDPGLLDRITAAVAKEGVTNAPEVAQGLVWPLSAAPGWDEAYSYALATARPSTGLTAPVGQREDVITDGMILAAVQALLGRVPDSAVVDRLKDAALVTATTSLEAFR